MSFPKQSPSRGSRQQSQRWNPFWRHTRLRVEDALGLVTQVATVVAPIGPGVVASQLQPNLQIGVQPTSDRVWSSCRVALKELTGCTYPGVLTPLKSAIETLLKCVDLMETTMENDEDHKMLASNLATIAKSLQLHLNDPDCNILSELIKETVKSIEDNVAKINAEQSHSVGRRLIESQGHQEEIKRCWKEIHYRLQHLQAEISIKTLKVVKQREMDEQLGSLNPSKLARYDSEPPKGVIRQYCAKDTRKKILQDLDSWSATPDGTRLLWMSGMAGTGKTTIAYSYARTLYQRQKLAASFFCSRIVPECREVGRLIPTIVYQLARFSPAFRTRLCEVLTKDPDLAHSAISNQFEYLLQAPLKGVDPLLEGTVVILDALDECDEQEMVERFLDHLIRCTEELPVKFLVTSRPESWIHNKMKSAYGPGFDRTVIPLHEMDKSSVQADIKLYLEQELAFISLSSDQLQQLVEQCGTLFIYAATLVRHIKPKRGSVPSAQRLEQILQLSVPTNSHIYAEIDLLYALVLDTALNGDLEEDEAKNVRLVMRTVLCAKEPISMNTIARLCNLDDSSEGTGALSFALERLRSVVYLSDSSDLVSVFHASFPDFMFDQRRAKAFHCDRAEHNYLMAEQCFGLMEELRFNICQLESSSIADEDAILQAQIDNTIGPALWYACRYWAEHLAQTTSSNLCEEFKSFLSRRLLFWMEVLNLKRAIVLGADVLYRANSWLTKFSTDGDLETLVEDARNFVTSFAGNPISISTPHIYTSLLPFCPRSSAIFKYYWGYFQGLAEPDLRAIQVREVAALASWNRKLEVVSTAYSHDGTYIAFGCTDGTVGVQNSYDGATIFSTSGGSGGEAHGGSVWSVAFAPPGGKFGNQAYFASASDDGTIRTWNILGSTIRSVCRPDPLPDTTTPGKIKSVAFSPKRDGTIASGSTDCTVCIWDSADGSRLAGPFRGHSKAIWTVAFSPDGALIASGSDDHTIRIWNPKNGELVLGPLTAQANEINAITFSPDGTRIASGSSDRTICVWDIREEIVISGPFAAHNDKVQSVAFSPDGKYLASSSTDRTIRVWDPLNGKLVAGPFEGHIGPIFSIEFSPDGTRIISGSSDGTIQLWDPRKGTLGDTALESHSGAVSSVAFSPDGRHLASGSYDSTLRVWAIHSGTSIVGEDTLRGHNKEVFSLSFSPDGTRIVTGSADRTARVWDLQDRTAPPVIFQGHSRAVWSVAFSPDGTFVASGGGSGDETVQLWDPSTGTLIEEPLKGHTNDVLSIAISLDGTSLASGSRDRTLRIWDRKETTTSRLLEGHTRAIWAVVYSRDGTKFASSSADGAIRIWDLQTDSLIGEPILAGTRWVSSIAFSPDGNYIVSGGNDCTIRLWDLSTRDLVGGPYEGHRDLIWSLSFSPDGTHIISGSHDGTIRMWGVKNAPVVDGNAGAGTIADGDWKIYPDGWIKHNSDLLLWVPHEVARSLLTPHCSNVISSCGPLRVDFSNLKLGKSWHECYAPRPV